MTTTTQDILAKLGLDPSRSPDASSAISDRPDVAHGFAHTEAVGEALPAWAAADNGSSESSTGEEHIDDEAHAAWRFRRDMEDEPTFVSAVYQGRAAALDVRRWAGDPRVVVVATRARRVYSTGIAFYLHPVGWTLAPCDSRGYIPSALILEAEDGEGGFCVINDDGFTQVYSLDADAIVAAREPRHAPELGAWLSDTSMAPWLKQRVETLAASDDGYDHAVAAGLTARLALATSPDGARTIMQRYTDMPSTPAHRVAAWAQRAPSKWLQDRWVDIDTQLEVIEALFDEIEHAVENPAEPEGAAAAVALRLAVAREELACVACVLLASGNESARGVASAIDRLGVARAHTAPFAEQSRDELLRAVGRVVPDAWWGQAEAND